MLFRSIGAMQIDNRSGALENTIYTSDRQLNSLKSHVELIQKDDRNQKYAVIEEFYFSHHFCGTFPSSYR